LRFIRLLAIIWREAYHLFSLPHIHHHNDTLITHHLPQPKEKQKKRKGTLKKKGNPEDDWLSELHAMHSAVGGYFGEEETKEDKAFFEKAKTTETEINKLEKEIMVAVDTDDFDLPASR